MSQLPNRPHSRSSVLAAKLVFAAAFLIVLLGVFLWVVRTFVVQPSQPLKLAVDVSSVRPSSAIRLQPDIVRPVFTGAVVDAQTHQPVVAFRALVGVGPDANSPAAYVQASGQVFSGGQYTISPAAGLPANYNMFVRIEARGYAPSVSTAQRGSATVDFQLTHTKDITGHVYGIDGKPVASVPLIVAISGMVKFDLTTGTVSKDGGRRVPFAPDGAAVVTAADGSYDFPPQGGNFLIVAYTAGGIVAATPDDIAKSTNLYLKPLASVEGHLVAGDNKPIGGSLIGISDAATSPPYLAFNANERTDDNGHYLFTNLPPVPVSINRNVDFTLGPEYPQLRYHGIARTTLTTLEPGKTINADHNGGREVAVKILFPPSIADAQYVISSSIWGRQFLGANAQLTRGQAANAYAFQYDGNNLFHIEDVQPGDYKIALTLQQTNANGWKTRPLRPQTASFTMPPITPDVADKPLVLPDITLPAN
ncbi:MAG: hypothetical protein ABSH22_19615 [Tepidisphaeraceae bacterium]|jgi:hypothetical protein